MVLTAYKSYYYDWFALGSSNSQLLAKTNPGLKDWLINKYSITEQKELMRAVIALPLAGNSASSSTNGSGPDTLRHEDWLLGSLVFWTQTSTARNGREMAEDLRRTQSARLERPAADAESRAVAPTIARGIRELQNGRIPSAEAAFAQAIKANRPASKKAFLSAYPEIISALELQADDQLCRDPLKNPRRLRPRLPLTSPPLSWTGPGECRPISPLDSTSKK
jgi:hypothetical protein